MRYLVKTKDMGLTYRRSPTFEAVGMFRPGGDEPTDGRLHAIGDASYVLPRSISGGVVMLAGAAVMWRVAVQRAPAISPAEAEFYALTNTVTETVTIRQLAEEMGYVFPAATQVFCDSNTARKLAEFGATTSKTRFIDRRYQFCTFYEGEGTIKIMPIRGARNPANALTKFTFGALFTNERAYILGLA